MKKNHEINYIVALYGGNRRWYSGGQKSPVLDFLKKHIAFLESNPKHITAATFAISRAGRREQDVLHDDRLISAIDDFKKRTRLKCFCYLQKNEFASYGAWNKAILRDGQYKNFTHSFLIEDDYIPCRLDFIDFFLQALGSEGYNAFAASQIASVVIDNNPVIHAAISNGLLDNSIIPTVLKDNSNLFLLKEIPKDHWSLTQRTYLDFIKNHANISDISKLGNTIFFKRNKYFTYGSANKPTLIQPLNPRLDKKGLINLLPETVKCEASPETLDILTDADFNPLDHKQTK